MKNCAWCGVEIELPKRRFCSTGCANTYKVTAWRRRMKRRSIEHKGGACERCGYSKCQAAMTFHHRGQNKTFRIGDPNARSWTRIRAELDQCDLLCLNCHAEEHFEEVHRTGIV